MRLCASSRAAGDLERRRELREHLSADPAGCGRRRSIGDDHEGHEAPLALRDRRQHGRPLRTDRRAEGRVLHVAARERFAHWRSRAPLPHESANRARTPVPSRRARRHGEHPFGAASVIRPSESAGRPREVSGRCPKCRPPKVSEPTLNPAAAVRCPATRTKLLGWRTVPPGAPARVIRRRDTFVEAGRGAP